MMRAARRVPEFGVPHRPVGLAALYDVADDWVPIYDKSDLPGFFMACGTSGNQFKNAPLAGQFMAAIIDAEAAGRRPRRGARAVRRRRAPAAPSTSARSPDAVTRRSPAAP